jgi:hypothetical protein
MLLPLLALIGASVEENEEVHEVGSPTAFRAGYVPG